MADYLTLGDGFFDDSRMWVFIVLAILTALGNLFKKKKKKDEEADKAIATKPPPPRPRPPVAPTPRAPRTEMPRARPKPVPQARIVRPLPASRPHRPRPPAITDPLAQLQNVPRPVIRSAEKTEQASREGRLAETPAAVVERPRTSPVREQVNELLSRRRGLQAAFVLSEILSAPLALRDEHLK